MSEGDSNTLHVKPEDAVRLMTQARRKRALAQTMREEWGDPTGARFELREAAEMEARAADALDPSMHTPAPLQPGRGGEVIPATKQNRDERRWLFDTVRDRPDMLSADASVRRMELADEARALVLGVDLAETIQAQNSAERMLAHQMAAAHSLAMKMAAKADAFLVQAQSYASPARQQVQSVEAARCAAASARLMEAFQRGMLTLERLRNGGRQAVVVQHVAVSDCGQAVVAGAVMSASNPGDQR